MASRRLSKSVSAAIKAHNAVSNPSLLLRSSPNSFLFRPNSFIGVVGNVIPTVLTQAAAHGHATCSLFPSDSLLRVASRYYYGYEDQKPLEKYGHDLTSMARKGKLGPVFRRDDEIRRCIQILCRMTKSNRVIVGEPGVGKTAIAEGLAQRIAQGDVPEPLLNRKLISLDMGSLLAGTKYPGQFEESLKAVLKEVTASSGQIILFIDEIHTVVGAGATRGGPMDASCYELEYDSLLLNRISRIQSELPKLRSHNDRL